MAGEEPVEEEEPAGELEEEEDEGDDDEEGAETSGSPLVTCAWSGPAVGAMMAVPGSI